MIAQYLSNTNEIGTIYILQKNLELNKDSKNFCKIDIVALSFVFDKYCPIMN